MTHTMTFRLTVAVTVAIELPDDVGAALLVYETASIEHQRALYDSLSLSSNIADGELTVTEVEQTDALPGP